MKEVSVCTSLVVPLVSHALHPSASAYWRNRAHRLPSLEQHLVLALLVNHLLIDTPCAPLQHPRQLVIPWLNVSYQVFP